MHEKDEQAMLIRIVRSKYPYLILHGNSTQTVGKLGKTARIVHLKNLANQGYITGFPDLFLFEPRGQYHGLAIEMKKARVLGKRGELLAGEKPRDEQIAIGERLQARGYAWVVGYGWEDALDKIERYLAM